MNDVARYHPAAADVRRLANAIRALAMDAVEAANSGDPGMPIGIEAQKILAAQDCAARVVSMPCWELFEAQPATYRDAMLGPGTVKVAIEAAGPMGWERYIGQSGRFSAYTASVHRRRPGNCTSTLESPRKPPQRPALAALNG
ncbi:MAG TPA: hypothetical protein VGM17_18730 [Rhizomicrobium sp.]|jgi:transketolase